MLSRALVFTLRLPFCGAICSALVLDALSCPASSLSLFCCGPMPSACSGSLKLDYKITESPIFWTTKTHWWRLRHVMLRLLLWACFLLHGAFEFASSYAFVS